MADSPRFAFHPLERRGLLLGLDLGQLLTIASAAIVAVAAHAAVGGAAGVLLGLLVAGGGLASALWVKDGVSAGARAVTGLGWILRGSWRSRVDDSPTAGRVARAGAQLGIERRPATRPHGIELIRHVGLPGEGALGVVRDRTAGTWAAVVPVGGCSFSLLDPTEQAYRLEGWRQVLGASVRPGSPVVRIQWIRRSWSDAEEPPELSCSPGERGSGAAAVGSGRRAASAEGSMVRHQTWIVLAVRPSSGQLRHPPPNRRQLGIAGTADRAVTELRRELRLLGGQLRDAALEPMDPLDLPQLVRMMAGPGVRADGTSGTPWPLATADRWSAHRADGAWHATYWIAEWPRVEVGPDFLTPLLVGSERTAVSVVMAPVASDRALREVRSARTADLADAELRARAGFLQSARRDRESEGVTRREEELADGHHDFRFSGYVTVSAGDPEGLTAACATVEHAAQSARLELRRLFGRQAEAYTWTLPLGRGLR